MASLGSLPHFATEAPDSGATSKLAAVEDSAQVRQAFLWGMLDRTNAPRCAPPDLQACICLMGRRIN